MDNFNSDKKNKYFNLGNVPSLITYAILLGVVFTVLRYHFYYQVLLHVPIFQFMDSSEFILASASSGTVWIIYFAGISLPTFIKREEGFTKNQKIIASFLVGFLTFFYLILNINNDPVLLEIIRSPLDMKIYLKLGMLIFLILIAVLFNDIPIFLKRNTLIIPLAISIWYALFEGWANYEVVTNYHKMNNMTVQTKSPKKISTIDTTIKLATIDTTIKFSNLEATGIISTNDTIVNAGRTRNYWFYYNRKTHQTRVVKVEDIEYTDFNSDNN